MKTLEINLATRPFRNNTLYWAGFGTAAGLLAVLTVTNIWLFVGYGSAVEQHAQALVAREARTSQLMTEERRLARKLGQLDFQELAKQAEFANGAIRRRIFSWTQLFNRLEEVVPPTVMMKGIRPEIQEDGISVLVGGMAKSQEGLLDFEEKMIQNVSFARIYPGSERREERGTQIKFFLKFEYVPDAEEKVLLAEASKESPGTPDEEGGDEPEVTNAEGRPSEAEGKVPEPGAEMGGGEEKGTAPEEEETEPGGERGAATPGSPNGVKPEPLTAGEGESKSDGGPEASTPPVPLRASAPSGDEKKGGGPVGKEAPPASAGPTRDPFREQAKAAATTPGKVPEAPKVSPPSGSSAPKPEGSTPTSSAAKPPAKNPVPPASSGSVSPGVFRDAPMSQVLNYLKTQRSLRFILDGEFDLSLRLNADLREKSEEEILGLICETLHCRSERKAHGLFQLTGSSPSPSLTEPAVQEEPLAGETGAEKEPS